MEEIEKFAAIVSKIKEFNLEPARDYRKELREDIRCGSLPKYLQKSKIISLKVIKNKVEDIYGVNPELDSAIWVTKFIMQWFNTDVKLCIDHIYLLRRFCRYRLDESTNFVMNVVEASTISESNELLSIYNCNKFWENIKPDSTGNDLSIIKINGEFMVIVGFTPTYLVLRTYNGIIHCSYEKLEREIDALMTIYPTEF